MKLNALTEARYVSLEQGTFEWFLKNFFEEYETEEMANGIAIEYQVKEDFEITARGSRVVGVVKYPNNDYEFFIKDSVIGHRMTKHITLEELVVKQVKTIWPKKT